MRQVPLQRSFVAFLCGLALVACGGSDPASGRRSSGPEPGADERPNVLLILVDDLGYRELGCYGGTEVPTPALDRLALDGVRFDRAYVTSSLCSPSRAGLLTGRYQQRFGHENNTGPLERQIEQGIGLPLAEITIARDLQQAGYRTALVGKWHLGASPEFHPTRRGFDSFFGHLSGGHTYLDWADPKNGPILRGDQALTAGPYLTDALTDEAIAIVEEEADAPFFLLLSYNAVHAPLEAPEADLAPFAHLAGERRLMAGMLHALDRGVGRVLAAVDQRGIRDETLVLFLNDNGAVDDAASTNGGLRAGKKSLYEGGIRVPLLVRWPDHVPAGEAWSHPVSSLDVATTLLAAAGVPQSEGRALDGRDLLEGPVGDPRLLFWRQGSLAAASDGRWKLVRTRRGSELYDLSADPGEVTDLAAERPTELAQLQGALAGWEAGLALPRWAWRDQ